MATMKGRRRLARVGLAFIVVWFAFWAAVMITPAFAQTPAVNPFAETRYCGPPLRDARGRIVRSHAVLAAFVKAHPCPSNGSRDINDACPGWAIDHTIPRVCGGCDAVSNLAWMRDEIKSCAGIFCKDRWEQKVYCDPPKIVSP